MKKVFLIYFIIMFGVFFNSCNKNQNSNIDNQSEKAFEENSSTEENSGNIEFSSETAHELNRILSNSLKFQYTRVLVCYDNFGELYYRPDLPIVLDGKFDNSRQVFIEIDREKFESPFKKTDNKYIVENKNSWLEMNKTYNYKIITYDGYALFLDDSITPKEGKTDITSCTRAGFIIYTKNFQENNEYYYQVIENDFKH